ncbi:MAG: DUF3793 family protein [Treponema sp.]|nr:DUF3793 family protein [Treponema sp.]
MSFDETVMRCGAPALCGIKPACLFSIRKGQYNKCKLGEWKAAFTECGKYVVALPRTKTHMLFFVYDRSLLERRCSECKIKRYLLQKGYPVEAGFCPLLAELLHRLVVEKAFPHEVGVFLGYPLEDVVAFEKTAGTQFRYSGSWKVYGDVAAAQEQMKKYRTCSTWCRRMVKRGVPVPLAVRRYIAINK